MGNEGTPPPAGPDMAALQTQISDWRATAGVLLGREVKPDESPGAIAANVAAQRAAASQHALEMRLGIAEGAIRSGYTPTLDLSIVSGVIGSDPAFAPHIEKKDWAGAIEAAAKAGLFSKAPPPAPGAPPVPPPIRPPAAPPDAGLPDKFAHVKTRADLAKLSPVQIATLQKSDPTRFATLIQ